jgi:hypothetical protein
VITSRAVLCRPSPIITVLPRDGPCAHASTQHRNRYLGRRLSFHFLERTRRICNSRKVLSLLLAEGDTGRRERISEVPTRFRQILYRLERGGSDMAISRLDKVSVFQCLQQRQIRDPLFCKCGDPPRLQTAHPCHYVVPAPLYAARKATTSTPTSQLDITLPQFRNLPREGGEALASSLPLELK